MSEEKVEKKESELWEDLANSFYCHIAHGDEQHRAWLKEETFKWFKNRSRFFKEGK